MKVVRTWMQFLRSLCESHLHQSKVQVKSTCCETRCDTRYYRCKCQQVPVCKEKIYNFICEMLFHPSICAHWHVHCWWQQLFYYGDSLAFCEQSFVFEMFKLNSCVWDVKIKLIHGCQARCGRRKLQMVCELCWC